MSESVVVGCWYTPAGIRLTPPTYDLTCNRPYTLRLFSEIGFRAWNPQAPKPRPYHLAIAAIKKIRGEFKVSAWGGRFSSNRFHHSKVRRSPLYAKSYSVAKHPSAGVFSEDGTSSGVDHVKCNRCSRE
ncbi:hypothetical protein AVEN_91183-1 [Araneus ventricosus]|uniref:Uncharacterized protein n=1 Tax=Araneus ventricosus TaxID=182803 RepID=A0A4Y2V4S4_ARAVE|nr:hypothetical protein AVEN_91183-1 [Araneus ventricosus]